MGIDFRRMKSKAIIIIILLFLIAGIATPTYRSQIRFDMSDGNSWEESYILGIKISSSRINSEVRKYAQEFNLTKTANPLIIIKNDRNLILIRINYYSKVRGDYFDLVSAAKILDKTDTSDSLYTDEKKRFFKLWSSLLQG